VLSAKNNPEVIKKYKDLYRSKMKEINKLISSETKIIINEYEPLISKQKDTIKKLKGKLILLKIANNPKKTAVISASIISVLIYAAYKKYKKMYEEKREKKKRNK
jgi:hypothetical protein